MPGFSLSNNAYIGISKSRSRYGRRSDQIFDIWIESESLYDWRFTANQFALAISPLSPTTSIFLKLDTCVHNPYVTSSRTRRWLCRL
jgi:hypothetical protein